MLKKLKAKFLLTTFFTMVSFIGTVIAAINLINYAAVINMADDTLELLMDNDGEFPNQYDDFSSDFGFLITPETPYQSRYFTILYEGDNLISANIDNIASIDEEKAVSMASSVKKSGFKQGFWTNYRFMVKESEGKAHIIFLDCTSTLNSANTFLILSIAISSLGVILMFGILSFISNKVLKPINDGYERQKQFITDAGHDIKTPITIIDADAELLEMDVGENEWLSDIKKQTARLASLTSDLIYLSRMEERETTPHTLFSISDIAEEVVSSFAAPAKTKGIDLKVSIAKNFSYNGDQESIAKLFSLLLDNAIKYSPENETVSFTLKKIGRNAYIKITNLAPDLTAETISHMFDRFYRSDKSRSSKGGFGIGLSVVDAIVSAHKGRISTMKVIETLVIEITI